MSKKAIRFQQRLGPMIGSGLFTRDPMPRDENDVGLSPLQSAELAAKYRLAKIRRAFEIQEEIASRLASGENVAYLREELAKVKSGEIKVPLSLARTPRPSPDFVGITAARKEGPALAPYNKGKHERRRPPTTISFAAVEGALEDLAKSKITPTAISVAKVMLDEFDISEVSDAINIPTQLLQKLSLSPLYSLAPKIPARDALVIVDVLEGRLASSVNSQPAQEPNTSQMADPDSISPSCEQADSPVSNDGNHLIMSEEPEPEPEPEPGTVPERGQGMVADSSVRKPQRSTLRLRAADQAQLSDRIARVQKVNRKAATTYAPKPDQRPALTKEQEAQLEAMASRLAARRERIKSALADCLKLKEALEQELYDIEADLSSIYSR